jgi:hypothetical protein
LNALCRKMDFGGAVSGGFPGGTFGRFWGQSAATSIIQGPSWVILLSLEASWAILLTRPGRATTHPVARRRGAAARYGTDRIDPESTQNRPRTSGDLPPGIPPGDPPGRSPRGIPPGDPPWGIHQGLPRRDPPQGIPARDPPRGIPRRIPRGSPRGVPGWIAFAYLQI